MSACGPPIARITRELTTNGQCHDLDHVQRHSLFQAKAALECRLASWLFVFTGSPRISNAPRAS